MTLVQSKARVWLSKYPSIFWSNDLDSETLHTFVKMSLQIIWSFVFIFITILSCKRNRSCSIILMNGECYWCKSKFNNHGCNSHLKLSIHNLSIFTFAANAFGDDRRIVRRTCRPVDQLIWSTVCVVWCKTKDYLKNPFGMTNYYI